MKGDVDGKRYIPIHISEDLDTTISKNLCYYKEEDFHGLPALSYTFGGTTNGVNNVGQCISYISVSGTYDKIGPIFITHIDEKSLKLEIKELNFDKVSRK